MSRCGGFSNQMLPSSGDGFIVGLSTTNLAEKYDAGTAIDYADMTYAVYYPSNLQGGTGTTEFFYTIQGATPVVTAESIEYIGDNSNNNNIIVVTVISYIWTSTCLKTKDSKCHPNCYAITLAVRWRS